MEVKREKETIGPKDVGKLEDVLAPSDPLLADASPKKKTSTYATQPIQWARFIKFQATPEKFQEAMWNAGLRTPEDLANNPRWAQVALGVLQSVYGVDLSAVLNGFEIYTAEHNQDKEK